MLFRALALAVFSNNTETLPPSVRPTQDKYSFRPFSDASNETIPVTRCQESTVLGHRGTCRCGLQQVDFCPYCDYRQTNSIVLNVTRSPTPLDKDAQHVMESSPIRPRKLRKVKPNYQQLRYEPLSIEVVESVRPASITSTHSRTPLLHPSRHSSTNYPALPTERRTPNKLEKRVKIRRAGSTTTFLPFSVPYTADVLQDSSKSSRSMDAPVPLPQLSQVSSSIGTDDLVSLAWTGEVQTTTPRLNSSENLSQSNTASSLSQVSPAVAHIQPRTRSKSMHSMTQRRRSLLRKPKDAGTDKEPPPPVPWSLAMAITDDKITDEKLVDQLEDMRIKKQSLQNPTLSIWVACASPSYQAVLHDSYTEYPPEPDELSVEEPSESSWNAARQALLLCREMLRTERRYLAALRTLARGGTATPPPAMMLFYIPRLITASDGFLQCMTKNPSVQGVSEAFLASQDQFLNAFVSWCSVVGSFFSQDDSGKPKTDPEDTSVVLRRIASLPTSSDAKRMEKAVVIEPNKIRRNSKSRPSVRDLAILPTQRIVRYVLLFKELLALTPITMLSSSIVAEALRVAQFIAQKCDEAQEHSAFKIPEAAQL